MKLLSIDALDVAFGGHLVLEDIHLDLARGEIVTIVGPNGSGKTTLLKSIIGALTPRRGRIEKAPGLVVGYVPQRLHLDATLPMTVSRLMRLPRRHSAHDIESALRRAGVTPQADSQISEISGGQFQRVLLARALLSSPDLLILDEATQGLDHQGMADFYRQIERVRQELGCAVLMVSHELHVVMRTSDRVICLNRSICCAGTPEGVAASPAYRAMFGHDDDDGMARYRHHHTPTSLEPSP